ncbi:MAG: hypothetical protein ACTSU2_03770 [Promethearchaeota archaeon]
MFLLEEQIRIYDTSSAKYFGNISDKYHVPIYCINYCTLSGGYSKLLYDKNSNNHNLDQSYSCVLYM